MATERWTAAEQALVRGVTRGDPKLPGRLLAEYGRIFDPAEPPAYTLL
ncbi:hypothetical protein [Streptomyces sp. NPDC058572]